MADPDACRFAKTHEWTFLDGGTAVVGLSDHAQKEITDVVFVELPKPGRRVAQGEACAVVESVKAAFDVYAPVSGEIAEVNAALSAEPALVNQSPYEKGWFFKIKADAATGAQSLMTHAQYQAFLKESAAH